MPDLRTKRLTFQSVRKERSLLKTTTRQADRLLTISRRGGKPQPRAYNLVDTAPHELEEKKMAFWSGTLATLLITPVLSGILLFFILGNVKRGYYVRGMATTTLLYALIGTIATSVMYAKCEGGCFSNLWILVSVATWILSGSLWLVSANLLAVSRHKELPTMLVMDEVGVFASAEYSALEDQSAISLGSVAAAVEGQEGPYHHIVVDLKAELFKKREEFDRSKQAIAKLEDFAAVSSNTKIKEYKVGRELDVAHEQRYGRSSNKSQKPISKQEKLKKKLAEEDRRAVSEAQMEASWVALQRKAKVYDELKRNAPFEEDEEDDEVAKKRRKDGEDKIPLVDFMRKHLEGTAGSGGEEEEDEDPWIESTDAFGRTRIVRKSESMKLKQRQAFVTPSSDPSSIDPSSTPHLLSSDMSRELQRQQWEQQALAEIHGQKEPLAPPEHFDAKREPRNLGVAFYGFSQHEEERKKQMDALELLRRETVGGREMAGHAKEERRAKLEERKAMLAERKKRRSGGSAGGGGSGVAEEDSFLDKFT
ncbi:hypothetical protein HDU98_009079 [Podochytrium sp. JEL0797]|nr:hypothetical protein HDU98_009079 [Podochytrium sp. JEL0797]